MSDPLVAFDCRVLDGRCNCKWKEGEAVPPMCKYLSEKQVRKEDLSTVEASQGGV